MNDRHFGYIPNSLKETLIHRQNGKKSGVSYCGLAIYIKKYLKAKEELCKLKYFAVQKYNLQKIL
jgi:hypothetical protein